VELGKLGEAEARLEEVVSIRKRLHGVSHPAIITPLSQLGMVLHARGRHRAAEGVLRETHNLATRFLPITDPSRYVHSLNLGKLLSDCCLEGNYMVVSGAATANIGNHARLVKEVEELFREAFQGYLATQGKHHQDTILAYVALGYILDYSGQQEEASELKKLFNE